MGCTISNPKTAITCSGQREEAWTNKLIFYDRMTLEVWLAGMQKILPLRK
jgi:hypothetical protein